MRVLRAISIVLSVALIALAVAVALSGSFVTRTNQGRISIAAAVAMGVIMLVSTLHQTGKQAATAKSDPRSDGGKVSSSTGLPKCPRCGNDVSDEYLACPYCGLTLKVNCPACGRQLKREFVVCPFCGHNLEGSLTAAQSPAPSPAPVERRSRRGGNRRTAGVAALVLLLCFGGFVMLRTFMPRAVSPAENAELWNKAHTALFQFIGEGMKTFGRDESRPATQKEVQPLSEYLGDFEDAVKRIARVTPPPEQAIMHQALLPIYQEMRGHMAAVRDSLLSGDSLRAELEWNRLALLLDQVAGVAEVLTLSRDTSK